MTYQFMKFIPLMFCLLFSIKAFSQDQIKSNVTNSIFKGKIIEYDENRIRLRMDSVGVQRIPVVEIELIYTPSDSLKRKLRYFRPTRDKISNVPLVGQLAKVSGFAKSDSIGLSPMELANAIQSDRQRIHGLEKRIRNSGNKLSTGGSLILVGAGISALGSIFLTGQSSGSKKLGAGIVVSGFIISLSGYGKIIRAGNILSGTNANSINIGITDHGLGICFQY